MYDPRIDREQTLGAKLAAFDRQITASLGTLAERMDAMAGHLVSVEASQRSLRSDVCGVMESLVARASEKFDRQEASLVALRADMQQ